jgi:hypothetical protein
MSAEPHPEPDLDTLARYVLPGQIAGVSYGVSLVHADTQAIRQELREVRGDVHAARQVADGHTGTLAEHGAALGELKAEQARQGEILAGHTQALADVGTAVQEILRRLPPAPED